MVTFSEPERIRLARFAPSKETEIAPAGFKLGNARSKKQREGGEEMVQEIRWYSCRLAL